MSSMADPPDRPRAPHSITKQGRVVGRPLASGDGNGHRLARRQRVDRNRRQSEPGRRGLNSRDQARRAGVGRHARKAAAFVRLAPHAAPSRPKPLIKNQNFAEGGAAPGGRLWRPAVEN